MAIYRLKIVGVHYAVNPDSFAHAEETELMHQRLALRPLRVHRRQEGVLLPSALLAGASQEVLANRFADAPARAYLDGDEEGGGGM